MRVRARPSSVLSAVLVAVLAAGCTSPAARTPGSPPPDAGSVPVSPTDAATVPDQEASLPVQKASPGAPHACRVTVAAALRAPAPGTPVHA